jgi:hypothetical protein
MSDFEVHEIGTANELKLARALVDSIGKQMQVNPLAIPPDIKEAYLNLDTFYRQQAYDLEY